MKTILFMRSPYSGSQSRRSLASRAIISRSWSCGIVANQYPASLMLFCLPAVSKR